MFRALQKNQTFLIGLAIQFLFLFSKSEFKMNVFVCSMGILFFAWVTKNIFLTVLTSYFTTLPFLAPGKYYSFPILEIGQVKVEPFFSNGMIEAYGLVLSDVLAVVLVFLSLRMLFAQRKKLKLSKFLIMTCVSWIFYVLITLIFSIFLSPYPLFSIVHTFQFGKLLMGAVGIWTLFQTQKKPKQIMVAIITSMLLFHSVFSFQQLISKFTNIRNNQQGSELTDVIEDESFFPRVQGQFLFANQLGLFCFWSFLIVMYSWLIDGPSWMSKLSMPLLLFNLIFSQSRSAWLVMFVVVSGLAFYYRTTVKRWLKKTFQNNIDGKVIAITLLGGIAVLGVLVPRLIATRYSFDEDGGSGGIRLQMIKEGFSVFRQLPLIGYGANTNVIIMARFFPDGYITSFPFAVHFSYLQMALESGLQGAVFFFLPIVLLVRRGLKRFFVYLNLRNLFQVFFGVGTLIYYFFQPYTGRVELPLLGCFFLFFLMIDFDSVK